MSSKWIDERENSIFTRVKNEVLKGLRSKYSDLNFTTDDSENVVAKFPSVYMRFEVVERGQTLDGGTINAVYMICQTKVSVTKAQGNTVAKEVNASVCDELKKLLFSVSGSAVPTTSGDIKEINQNYARVLGYNDPL